jgi:hypothetical protein
MNRQKITRGVLNPQGYKDAVREIYQVTKGGVTKKEAGLNDIPLKHRISPVLLTALYKSEVLLRENPGGRGGVVKWNNHFKMSDVQDIAADLVAKQNRQYVDNRKVRAKVAADYLRANTKLTQASEPVDTQVPDSVLRHILQFDPSKEETPRIVKREKLTTDKSEEAAEILRKTEELTRERNAMMQAATRPIPMPFGGVSNEMIYARLETLESMLKELRYLASR